ncbi:MAG: MFS transporter [Chloroflexi bacterium]|nr:MFS transporter [Chloroflexota bacterium]
MNSQERLVTGYASAAHFLVHALELTYAAVLIRISQEFGSGLFLLGLVANVAALAYGLAALPAGVLSDRVGSQRLVTVCLLASAVAAFVVVFSPTVYLLAVALTGLGLAIGLYHPAGMSLISRGVRQRVLALGYHGMMGNLGMAMAPLLAGSIAWLVGWRGAYVFLAVVALLLAGALRFAPLPTAAPSPSPESVPTAKGKVGLGPALIPLLAVYAAFTLNGFIFRGTMTFLPAYMAERISFSILNIDPVALAGSLASLALMCGVVGQYLGGALAQRMSMEGVILPLAGALAPTLFLVGGTRDGLLLVSTAAFTFTYFMAQPIYNALVAEYSSAHFQGRSFGISFFCSFGLGSFAAGFSGLVAERLGTNWIFYSLAVVGLLVFGLAIYLWRRASYRMRVGSVIAE